MKYKSFSLCNSLISTGQGQGQAVGSLPFRPAPPGERARSFPQLLPQKAWQGPTVNLAVWAGSSCGDGSTAEDASGAHPAWDSPTPPQRDHPNQHPYGATFSF